ncbi:trimeric LpxA-like protein [Cladorrhinum sp. PSN259]|nr:trimeric LpxA-like protein [Cladorrhinum sp. PSN259]
MSLQDSPLKPQPPQAATQLTTLPPTSGLGNKVVGTIHPTSIIHPTASIHPSATVGPFCLVGPSVTIRANTTLLSHVTVQRNTSVGSNCLIHPFVVLGGSSQALADCPDSGRLTVGNNCVIRECVTANLGTSTERGTTIGDGCLIMANAHVGHDCTLGEQVILTNGVLLAGHVKIGRGAILAGGSAVVQFCEVGEFAYVGGKSAVSRDVLPFVMVKGWRGKVVGVNAVGLKRRGWGESRIRRVQRGVGMILKRIDEKGKEGGLIEEEEWERDDEEGDIKRLVEFVKKSKNGICMGEISGAGVAKI